MIMELFRNCFIQESHYIFANIYFYDSANAITNAKHESVIKPTVNFLGEVLHSVRHAVRPKVPQKHMKHLVDLHFPNLMSFIQEKSKNQGLEFDSHFFKTTILDLKFFEESFKFYLVRNF